MDLFVNEVEVNINLRLTYSLNIEQTMKFIFRCVGNNFVYKIDV